VKNQIHQQRHIASIEGFCEQTHEEEIAGCVHKLPRAKLKKIASAHDARRIGAHDAPALSANLYATSKPGSVSTTF
jgi:hypothetical protein